MTRVQDVIIRDAYAKHGVLLTVTLDEIQSSSSVDTDVSVDDRDE